MKELKNKTKLGPVKVLRYLREDRMRFPRRGVKCWGVRRHYYSTVGINLFSVLRKGVDMTPYTHLGRIAFKLEMVPTVRQKCCSYSPFVSINTLNRERTDHNF